MPLQRTRNFTSAFVAISMLASSAASAAPAPKVDPLVALSLLSTDGSRAAVCGPGCSEGSMATVSAGSGVAAAAGAAQDPYDAPATPRGSMMPLWVALAVVLAGWAWILLDDETDNDEAESPA